MSKKISQLARANPASVGPLVPVAFGGVSYAVPVSAADPGLYGALVPNSAAAAVANAAAINAAIVAANAASVALTGPIELLLPAGKYWISTTLLMLSNVTLRGAGMGKTTLYMPAASFTNTVQNTFSATSVAISALGALGGGFAPATNISLCDFTIESQVSDGRYLYPIVARNVVGLDIARVEIFGIPAGDLIACDSIVRGEVHSCYLHDCTSAVVTSLQTTGIETDGNRVNAVNCRNVKIYDNTIESLTMTGAAFPGGQNMQTDGITLGLGSAHGVLVFSNYIKNVGEGIDCWSSECAIFGNELVDCNNVGIKLIHGASRNHIYGNTIVRPGLAGLYMGSSNTAASNENYLHDNLIHDVSGNGPVWAAGSRAGIRLDINGAHAFKVNNNTFRDNKITGGVTNPSDYAIRADDGTGNRFYDNEAETWTVAYSSAPLGTPTIVNAKKTLVRAGLNAVEATAAGVEKIVQFETEEADTQAEFDPTTFTYTANSHRRLSVKASVQCATGAAGENWQLRIKKNGAVRAQSSQWSGGAVEQFAIADAFGVVPGDTVAVFVFQNNGARNIGGSVTTSYLMIEEVAG